ncbi:hypothetical protein ElyMa_001104900 [Elysia marginata]|uniref:Uncharacterized protein n=1 Tax=Elysia marginata TaxID=1093978 RepID=A0AAV4HVK3_9GAST|nr:hypothetical protein ElyMa_001104900 [Elysia marginata]
MTGAETYKQFDTTSIVSSSPTQDTVKVGSMRFRKRDLVFGGIALLALLMVLVLAIVLAVEVGKKDRDDDDDKSVSAVCFLTSLLNTPCSHARRRGQHYGG